MNKTNYSQWVVIEEFKVGPQVNGPRRMLRPQKMETRYKNP